MFSNLFSPEDDPYKSDIFSLGMLTLMLGNLQPIDHLYNYEQAAINGDQLDSNITKFSKAFSPQLTNLVERMLEEDEIKRISAQDINNNLMALGSTSQRSEKDSPEPNLTVRTEESRVNVTELHKLVNNGQNNSNDHFLHGNTILTQQPTIGKEPYFGAHLPNEDKNRLPEKNVLPGGNFRLHSESQSQAFNHGPSENFRIDTSSNPSALEIGSRPPINNNFNPPPSFNSHEFSSRFNEKLDLNKPPSHQIHNEPPKFDPVPFSAPKIPEETSTKDYNQRRVDEIIESIKKRTQEMKGDLGVKEEPSFQKQSSGDPFKSPNFASSTNTYESSKFDHISTLNKESQNFNPPLTKETFPPFPRNEEFGTGGIKNDYQRPPENLSKKFDLKNRMGR